MMKRIDHLDRFLDASARPDIRQLAERLSALPRETIGRICAAVTSPMNLARWQRSGLRPTRSSHPCVSPLVNPAIRKTLAHTRDQIVIRGKCHGGCRPPAGDHCSLWSLDGAPAVYVMQPYVGALRPASLYELHEFCLKRELEDRIFDSDVSWHFPGKTALIAIARPGTWRVLEERSRLLSHPSD